MLNISAYDYLIVNLFGAYDKIAYLCTNKKQLTPKSRNGKNTMRTFNYYKCFGFFLEKSIAGQYRLMMKDVYGNESFVAEDPDCEDLYDEDCAEAIWADYIKSECKYYLIDMVVGSKHSYVYSEDDIEMNGYENIDPENFSFLIREDAEQRVVELKEYCEDKGYEVEFAIEECCFED